MNFRVLIRVSLVASGSFLLLIPSRVSGFGKPGHELVGAIADNQMKQSPAALAQLKKTIGNLTLEQLAPVPDAIRSWDDLPDEQKALKKVTKLTDEKGRLVANFLPSKIRQQLWEYFRANLVKVDGQERHHAVHFDDVTVADGTPMKYEDGAIGTKADIDLVNTIAYCYHVLHHDAAPDPLNRKITPAVAVILLAHLVGDLHQPLHVGAEYFQLDGTKVVFVDPAHVANARPDRGGNLVAVRVPGFGNGHSAGPSMIPGASQENLHAVWDDDTVDEAMSMWRAQFHLASNSARSGVILAAMANGPVKGVLPASSAGMDGVVRGWATEILPLAKEARARLIFSAYPANVDNPKHRPIAVSGVRPGENYMTWAGGKISEELLRGGYRLAWLIQQAQLPAK